MKIIIGVSVSLGFVFVGVIFVVMRYGMIERIGQEYYQSQVTAAYRNAAIHEIEVDGRDRGTASYFVRLAFTKKEASELTKLRNVFTGCRDRDTACSAGFVPSQLIPYGKTTGSNNSSDSIIAALKDGYTANYRCAYKQQVDTRSKSTSRTTLCVNQSTGVATFSSIVP